VEGGDEDEYDEEDTGRDLPQELQNVAPSGLLAPQLAQNIDGGIS
jgi:hypothetical protein